MNGPHGLSPRALATITRVLAHHPAVEKALLFGSRAKGTHKPGSDIDLALIGTALDWRVLGRIYDEFDDSSLPHRFSLVIYDSTTDAEVAAHIQRVGLPLFDRELAGEAVLRR